MSESNKNELDKLFQTRLSNDTPADNGWNVPPIDLFDNAMDALEPKEKDRKPLWLPFLFGSLMIGGMIYMFVYNHKMFDKLDTKIENLQSQTIEKNTQKVNEGNSPTFNNINAEQQNLNEEAILTNDKGQQLFNHTLSKNTKNSQQNVVTPKLSSKVASPVNSNKQRTQVINYTDDLFEQSIFNNNTVTGSFNSLPLLSSNENSAQNNAQAFSSTAQNTIADFSTVLLNKDITPIQSLGSDLLGETLAFPLLHNAADVLDVQISDKQNRFTPYLLMGTHLSSFTMSGENMENASLTKYDQNCLGYQFGIGLMQQLSSKWSLDYGISYRNIINHSIYNDQTNYSKSNEYINDYGSLMYADEMTIVTPTGIYVDNMSMPVSEQEMQDGDVLENTTNTKQVFHTLNASLGINYAPIRVGNFALSLNTGASINRILNAQQDMDMEVSFKGKVMASDTYKIEPNFNGNHMFYTGFIGFRLDYQVTDKIALMLDNRFERSLNSLNTIQSANAPSTILHSLNTGLKIGYWF